MQGGRSEERCRMEHVRGVWGAVCWWVCLEQVVCCGEH